MMMDDIYFSDPAKCAECHKKYELGTMVWLKGRCICPECYEKRRKELDYHGGKKE